jgi:hypothetical protein
MRGHQSERLSRWAGLCIGMGLVLAVVLAARIPPGSGSIGAAVTVVAIPSGSLATAPSGPILQVDDMRPGGDGRTAPNGSVRITNISDHRVQVHVHLMPSTKSLDDVLRVRLVAEGDVLLRGAVGGLGRWSPRSISLGPGGSAEVEVATWLPPSTESGYQGAIDDLTLEFHTRRAGD